MDTIRNVIIIGSGPAGHTAAIYTARARLQPLLFEGFMAGGVAAGGQLTTTSLVENFPGFQEGIDGPVLMETMRAQSQNFGTEIITETVEKIDISNHPFVVHTQGKEFKTKSIIIATGATAKRLHIKDEETFWDKGISACAVCDGALPLFRDKPLLVIGGGDSACEEAYFLTKFGSTVYIAVRRNVLRASKTMQERILHHPKIKMLWETQPEEALGKEHLESVILFNSKDTSKKTTLHVSGLFYAVGHTPNTAFLQNTGLQMDTVGYIITEPKTTCTNINGIFACGDVQDAKYRQAITAAGSGCMAALDAEHYVSSL